MRQPENTVRALMAQNGWTREQTLAHFKRKQSLQDADDIMRAANLTRIVAEYRAEKGEEWWEANVTDDWNYGGFAGDTPAQTAAIRARANAEWNAL